jgi:PKD repeat protein
VDGAGDQRVAIDYGSPVAVGDTYAAANDGGVSTPVWRLVRRLHAASATPGQDDIPTLPTPTGLILVKGLYNPDAGQEVQAWIDAHWLTLPHRYGQITYQVACLLTTDPGATPLVLATQDPWPSTYLAREISATETTIPRVVYGGRFSIGRIQILQEKIDFTAATSEEGVGGSPEYPTGIGSANSFYDAAANWTVGQWRNFALRDSNDDLFHITGNSGNTLTVIGTPADGAYFIYPAFCNCSRGVGSTDAVPHDAARGVIGRSWGLLFAGLRAGTDYSVRVRATNAAGATSAWTSWVSIETDPDLTIPPTPTGLTVESADGGVVLEWTGPTLNTTPDLAGFYVFRSADGEDPIKEVGLRNETFVSAELGVEHYYALKSFDTSMNVSPLTSWVLGTAHPATVVNPGALLFTRTGELAEKLNIEAGDPSPHSPPVPGFSPSSTEITLGAAITFTNTSVGATAYLWEFGDGETSADTHPVHTFASAGVFRVRLTCYSDWGEQFIVGKTPITVNASVPEDRVTAGLQYLALFNEGVGRVVYDHSEVGLAYDTTIHGDVTWGSESLTINEDTLISGGVIFSKVIDACMATDEIT